MWFTAWIALKSDVKHLHEHVQEMPVQGIIQPLKSPWAGPMVLIEKKDGSVDYHQLNAVTKIWTAQNWWLPGHVEIKNFHPDFGSGFGKSRWGLHSSREKTFMTHLGLYEFGVIHFGLVNAPLTFQQLMESVLIELSGEKINVLSTSVPPSIRIFFLLNSDYKYVLIKYWKLEGI